LNTFILLNEFEFFQIIKEKSSIKSIILFEMKIFILRQILALILITYASVSLTAQNSPDRLKPFNVLVIIGDQWKDPASYLIEVPQPTGEYSGYDAAPEVDGDSDFHHLVILLKSWGIPFDIVRLDQQLLDRYMFLDMYNKPKYGTVIWDVNPTDNLLPQDYSIVTEMVKEYGIGLIAISDRIIQPEIQDILGLKYNGSWESTAPIITKGKHFITEGLSSPFVIDKGITGHLQRQQAEVLEGTVTIVEQGSYPQVTLKEYPSGAHVVWLGSDHNYLFYFQKMRTILRRSLTWTIGYNIYKTWDNDLIMIMDDPGGSTNNWLEHWQYPVLTEELITKYLIDPLVKHNAVLNINFVPAFVNDTRRRLEPTWNENFVDKFGAKQDYVSSKRGYDKGVGLGVFTVMSHGLTHMQPDLVSDPGWYGSSLDKERSEVGWYREFGDTRRKKEIPPAEQLWRMKISKEWLTEQFGVTPLQFCPGGLGTSVSYFNNTAKLAGEAGYGWCGWETGYLGKDMVITGWKFFGTSESPLLVPSLPDAHDFGITREPEKFAEIFDIYPNGRFMSMNEFIGYLHAKNSGNWNSSGKQLTLAIDYDPYYCQFFETNTSIWNLEFADWLEKGHGKPSSAKVNGKAVKLQSGKIEIPKGIGKHKIEISFK
jgi:hypothetical protein